MYRTLTPIALLMLTLSACSTPVQPTTQPVKPQISESLRTPCEPLPHLEVKPGEKDMRPELLRNRADAERAHAECTARHSGVLRAVGVEPSAARAARQARIRAERDNNPAIEE